MTSEDVRERLLAEARERPFLLFRDGDERQRLAELSGDRLTVGRRDSADVALTWDGEVSRLHVELVRMGADWVACDEGLSHNGTFVNGERLRGRRRLAHGDVLRCGDTMLVFRSPRAASDATVAAGNAPPPAISRLDAGAA